MPLRVRSSVSVDIDDVLERIRYKLDRLIRERIPYMPKHVNLDPDFGEAIISIEFTSPVNLPFLVRTSYTAFYGNALKVVLRSRRVRAIDVRFSKRNDTTYVDKVYVLYDEPDNVSSHETSDHTIGFAHIALPEVLGSLKHATINVRASQDKKKAEEWFERFLEALNVASAKTSTKDEELINVLDLDRPLAELSVAVKDISKSITKAEFGWSKPLEYAYIIVENGNHETVKIEYNFNERELYLSADKNDLDLSDLADILYMLSEDKVYAKVERSIARYLKAYATLMKAHYLMSSEDILR